MASSSTVVYQLRVRARGEQRGLVEHVGEICAGETGGLAGDDFEVDALREGLALAVYLEDLLSALEVGRVHADLTVEATGAQKRGVEDVGTVGRRDHDDVRVRVEAVHLDQHLVEGLLALIVAAAHTGAAVTADGVDLVDEDDGGRILLGLAEEVAHARGADADEHLDEVGTGDGVERGACLAGDGAGEERLAGSGRAVQQHALRDAGADGLELRGVLEELLDLMEFFDGLVGTGDIGEGDRGGLLVDELGLGLAELHDLAAATLHGRQEPPEQQAEQHQRKKEREEAVEPGRTGNGVVEAVLRSRLVDRADHLVGAGVDVVELHVLRALEGLRERHVHALVAVGVHDLGDRRAGEQLEPLLRRDLLGRAQIRDQQETAEQEHADQRDVDQRIPGELLHIHDRISVSRAP